MTNLTTIRNDRYQQDEVLSAVNAAGSVLLFCHVSPDGDTLGSALALKKRLERMGKQTQVMVDGFVPSYLAFLPEADSILGRKISLPTLIWPLLWTLHRLTAWVNARRCFRLRRKPL